MLQFRKQPAALAPLPPSLWFFASSHPLSIHTLGTIIWVAPFDKRPVKVHCINSEAFSMRPLVCQVFNAFLWLLFDQSVTTVNFPQLCYTWQTKEFIGTLISNENIMVYGCSHRSALAQSWRRRLTHNSVWIWVKKISSNRIKQIKLKLQCSWIGKQKY